MRQPRIARRVYPGWAASSPPFSRWRDGASLGHSWEVVDVCWLSEMQREITRRMVTHVRQTHGEATPWT